MQEAYRTVLVGGIGVLEEKKSRFIAEVEHVESEEEAAMFLAAIRKKYWDASHHCSAYIIGRKQELKHCSDDGEPSGTAGRPMLDVLTGEGLCDVIVVVTRYFGGTLLGTGGLVRAYSGAAKEGLSKSEVIEKKLGRRIAVTTDYNSVGKLQYLVGKRDVETLSADYTDVVRTELLAVPGELDALLAEVSEATAGRAAVEVLGDCYFAKIGKEVRVFESVESGEGIRPGAAG